MPPKKDQSHYYGFDSSGLEKAAAVSTFPASVDTTTSLGCQIPRLERQLQERLRHRTQERGDQAA